jgi:hypothetical protein
MVKTKTGTSSIAAARSKSRWTKPFMVLAMCLGIVGITLMLTQRYLWHAWLPLQSYRSEELGFELQVPAGWKAQEAVQYQQIAFSPPGKGANMKAPRPGIAVSRNQPLETETVATADQYFSQLEKTLAQSLASKDETSKTTLERYRQLDQKRTHIGKHQALLVHVAIDNFGHQTGVAGEGTVAYIYVSRQRQYVLAATASTRDPAFTAQQERIILTFRTLE